jgi:TonB-dependent starch-binding outer membrane protein SusC
MIHALIYLTVSFSATDLHAQQLTSLVKGVVQNTNNEPLVAVSVVIRNNTTNFTSGTSTDSTGTFTFSGISAGGPYSFTLSSVGYEPQTLSGYNIKENVTLTLSLKMAPISNSLDQVIVVGYGTQKKSDLTGSVVRVSMDDKSSLANVNLFQALSGAVAGVNVQGAGLAGSEPDLSIRGQTSLSASDRPLVVVNGIIYNGAIADINVSDIESVDILKDASAAAVYGSRSANGVMLITTKKGKSDKPVVTVNMYYGYQDMTNNPMKAMNAEQYAVRLVDYYYQQDLYSWYRTRPTSATGKPVRPDVTDRNIVAARLRTQEERENYLAGNEINWIDEVTQVAPIQNYNVSLSGKAGATNYFLSGSYTNEQGILRNDKFKRYTLNTNIESKVTSWFTLGFTSTYSLRDYSGLEASLAGSQAGAMASSPLANNKIGSPKYDMYLTGEAYMPYPLNNLYVDNKDISNNLFMVGRAKITVPWIKGLNYELNYSNTYTNRNNNTFFPVNTPSGSLNKGQAIKSPFEEKNWIVNNIVSYLGDFGDHQVNGTLLYSRENRNSQSSTLTSQGFDNPVLGYNNVGLGTLATVQSAAWEENSISYMARANYSFQSKYLLTATFRRDGFSGFGPNAKFASFPSVSLGWVVSKESFMSDVNGLDLKLRLSYGKNGNQGIGRYSSFTRMTSAAYVYGPTTAIGVYPNSLGNADLGWETTSSYNLGIDFGILNRRITGSIELYKAKTTDVLVSRALPPATGYPSVWTNIGAIDNKGVELELTTINLEGPLQWKTNFAFSLNRDKISKLYGDVNDKDIGNSWFVGESISAIYDYEMAGGLWTEAELYKGTTLQNWYPGQFRYVDQNSDGVIEPNADRAIVGRRTPNYRFSINNTFTYKNFSFSFFVNSIQGGNNYYLADNSSVVNVSWNSDDVYRINASAVRPYWTPDNGVNNSTGVLNTPVVRSGIYESRSFVRLQDVSLGYVFGAPFLKSVRLQSCQVYLSSKNPYTWTDWSGWDPEIGVSNSPLMRNITAGFRLTF